MSWIVKVGKQGKKIVKNLQPDAGNVSGLWSYL